MSREIDELREQLNAQREQAERRDGLAHGEDRKGISSAEAEEELGRRRQERRWR